MKPWDEGGLRYKCKGALLLPMQTHGLKDGEGTLTSQFMEKRREKVDRSSIDAILVIIESNRTESKEQDTSSRSGNDAHVDDADIRPIYNEEPMAENAEQCHDTCPLPAKLTDDKTIELSDQSLEFENDTSSDQKPNDSLLEQLNKNLNEKQYVLAIFRKRGFAIAALKIEVKKLTGNSVHTKFCKPHSGKPLDNPRKNQSVD
ncbi:hypothetical protein Tco_0401792 [Tanacetum coccineum]